MGVVGQRHAPDTLPRERQRVPIYKWLGELSKAGLDGFGKPRPTKRNSFPGLSSQ